MAKSALGAMLGLFHGIPNPKKNPAKQPKPAKKMPEAPFLTKLKQAGKGDVIQRPTDSNAGV